MSLGLSTLRSNERINFIEAGRIHPLLSFARSTTATYQVGAGLLATAAVNIPRFEYDNTGVYVGLLLEGASTNLLLHSDPTLAQLDIYGGVTQATSPIIPFFTNSIQFPLNSATSNYAYEAYNVAASTIYTLSIDVKMDDLSLPKSSGTNGAADDLGLVMFSNLAAGNAAYLGNNVYRLTQAGTSGAAGYVSFGAVQYSSNSQKAFRITGYQLEQSGVASSYIPTNGATATRSEDVLQLPNLSSIKTAQGTFVIEHDVPAGQPLLYSGSNKILDSTGAGKIVIAYDVNGTAISLNGGAVTTSATALTFGTTLDIGKSPSAHMNGHIKSLTYYKTRRLNADIVRMSV
jgi:hypothetical protein